MLVVSYSLTMLFVTLGESAVEELYAASPVSILSYSAITCAPSNSSVAATSRLSSTMMPVASEPYTTLTCVSVPNYQRSTRRMNSQSRPAVAPPISACCADSLPTGMK